MRKGVYIFSFRPLEHWERKMLVDNSYRNTNYPLKTKMILSHVKDKTTDTIALNKEFKVRAPANWFTYKYTDTVFQIYPRNFKWLDINIPNNHTITSYLPTIVSIGDTLVFEAQGQEPGQEPIVPKLPQLA